MSAGHTFRSVRVRLVEVTLACVVLAVLLPSLPGTVSALDASSKLPAVGVVSGDRVNVRPGPSRNHFAFTQFPLGTRLVVCAERDGWMQVYLPADRTCWVHGDYLARSEVREGEEPTMRVLGNRVRVRLSPDVRYTPLGHVGRGQVLRSTGLRDKETGQWVQCYAPMTAKVWIHKDFVTLGRGIAPSEVQKAVARFTSVVKRENSGQANAGGEAAGNKSSAGAVRSNFSKRLRELHERYRKERQKPIEEWDFSSIRRDIQGIEDGSEDLAEVEGASVMLQVIDEAALLKRKFSEIEIKKSSARDSIAENEQKESDVAKAVHRIPPTGESKEYLASGWIVLLGKHNKVGGTHRLMKGNKTLFYLKSDMVKLDDFVNKRVGVRGYKKQTSSDLDADLVIVTEMRVLSE